MTGSDIRKARLARGLSTQELATEAGVPYFTVYNWERQRNVPRSRKHRDAIVDCLNRIPLLKTLDKR